ncbi:ATP-grasp domain-containing protein [Streptomyces sp. NPDC058572]|uniref:ATP-grasp domain-containing protein n=1 Tax=Streptomyces sp. NPDC058572 TaxID=3346546 RepID=UPI003658BC39
MPTPVLYCSDPLNPRRVDAHFAAEAHEVRAAGGDIALIDHDALLQGDAGRAVARVPQGMGAAWYRGWMIPADRYVDLSTALLSRRGGLLTAPDRYRAAHELPGWYGTFREVTPASVWRQTDPGQTLSAAELSALAAQLPAGPVVVKDFVKSRKDAWDEACYISDPADARQLHRIVGRFVELQAEFLAGGIVLRSFERFVRDESIAPELRVWWLDGEPRLITPHPDSRVTATTAPELAHVVPSVRSLGCRFVTTDVALREDGTWRVIEVGDGQVSDLHPAWDPAALAGLLAGE